MNARAFAAFALIAAALVALTLLVRPSTTAPSPAPATGTAPAAAPATGTAPAAAPATGTAPAAAPAAARAAGTTTPPIPTTPGVSGVPELDELVRALGLTPEQREKARLVLLETEHELDRAVRALPESSPPDVAAMQRATDAVVARANARIRELLDPRQRQAFDAGARR